MELAIPSPSGPTRVASDFHQLTWDEQLRTDWQQLLFLAVREDLDRLYDWTTVALVPADVPGRAAVVARQEGVVAGLPAAEMAIKEFDRETQWEALVTDGTQVSAGERVAVIAGKARSLLTAERTMLNVLTHLSGVATLTRRYVDAVAGTNARIYDTRKTTPGWRRLEKYAVRAGGGWNHRTGLYDAILIKDNHLACSASRLTPAAAVAAARAFLVQSLGAGSAELPPIEVEVDTLDQLANVLPAAPDIVLLDNMSLAQLRSAVALRSQQAPQVVLEASGGVNLETVAGIAATGVDRISVGALTHSAPNFDLGLDWTPL